MLRVITIGLCSYNFLCEINTDHSFVVLCLVQIPKNCRIVTFSLKLCISFVIFGFVVFLGLHISQLSVWLLVDGGRNVSKSDL